MVDSISSIGLAGVHRASQRIAEIADRISSPDQAGSPEVQDLVDLKVEEHAFKASAAVIKVGSKLEDTVLDILA